MADYKHTASTFSYEIKKHIGTIAEYQLDTKEINLICYNNAPTPKYDIRTWTIGNDGTKKLGKGLTLNETEFKALQDILANYKV